MMNQMKDILRQSYNKYAEIREKNELQPWKVLERDKFFQLLAKEGRTSLLDIGAGTGKDSRFFIEKGFNVTAVDLSDEMVKLCHGKGVQAYEMDFYNLSLLGCTFDAAWAMNSLLHIEKNNLEMVLQGIWDRLNPSGVFFMGVYGGEDFEGIWEEDIYTPHRFFSFYSDESIKEIVSNYFEPLNFDTIETGGKYHFQSITMRKK